MRYDSTQLLLLSLYRFCKTGEIVGERVRAILSKDLPDSPVEIKGFEPLAGESPCVPPLGTKEN